MSAESPIRVRGKSSSQMHGDAEAASLSTSDALAVSLSTGDALDFPITIPYIVLYGSLKSPPTPACPHPPLVWIDCDSYSIPS